MPEAESRPRILIAEDDKLSRLKLEHFFSRQLDAELVLAEDGEQAWQLYNEAPVDIIISDWEMPGMTGPELCQRVRSDASQFTYFLLLTSRTEQADMLEGMSTGADDYVRKPYDPPELLARVRSGLRRIALEEQMKKLNDELGSAYNKIREALHAAGQMQRKMIPSAEQITELGLRTGLQLDYRYVSCDDLGGDVLGMYIPDQDHVALFLADVSGHGVAASIAAVSMHTFLQTVLHSDTDPLKVMAAANQFACEEFPDTTFATMAYFLFDVPRMSVDMIIAGHPPVLKMCRDGSMLQFESSYQPLGIFDDPPTAADVQRVELGAGERLIAYTDGVIETRNPTGRFYSLDFLFADIQARAHRPLEGLSQSILDAVANWRYTGEAEDDITVLAMSFQEVAALKN
ncbi:SpoIIE family protein phosphatase [bacterium]|nr:SpoIIE family protein phosphatase [bacterium]